jgi:hypothetical protein
MQQTQVMGGMGAAMNAALPEQIRVKAMKGFRAMADGQFGVVNPGDVVVVDRLVALELRAAQKAVMTDEPLKRQKDYVPERKKNARPSDASQIATLSAQVATLTQQVATLIAPATADAAKDTGKGAGK